MLNALRRNSEKNRLIQVLYAALTAQARQPAFFREYGVADTIDGRFDMVALHAWLVFGRLAATDRKDLVQALSDAIFVSFDEALREQGSGDMGMGPRMKKLALAFNGRMQAYETATDETAMRDAILRNVYRGEARFEREAQALARYAFAVREHLKIADPLDGRLEFGPIPTTLH